MRIVCPQCGEEPEKGVRHICKGPAERPQRAATKPSTGVVSAITSLLVPTAQAKYKPEPQRLFATKSEDFFLNLLASVCCDREKRTDLKKHMLGAVHDLRAGAATAIQTRFRVYLADRRDRQPALPPPAPVKPVAKSGKPATTQLAERKQPPPAIITHSPATPAQEKPPQPPAKEYTRRWNPRTALQHKRGKKSTTGGNSIPPSPANRSDVDEREQAPAVNQFVAEGGATSAGLSMSPHVDERCAVQAIAHVGGHDHYAGYNMPVESSDAEFRKLQAMISSEMREIEATWEPEPVDHAPVATSSSWRAERQAHDEPRYTEQHRSYPEEPRYEQHRAYAEEPRYDRYQAAHYQEASKGTDDLDHGSMSAGLSMPAPPSGAVVPAEQAPKSRETPSGRPPVDPRRLESGASTPMSRLQQRLVSRQRPEADSPRHFAVDTEQIVPASPAQLVPASPKVVIPKGGAYRPKHTYGGRQDGTTATSLADKLDLKYVKNLPSGPNAGCLAAPGRHMAAAEIEKSAAQIGAMDRCDSAREGDTTDEDRVASARRAPSARNRNNAMRRLAERSAARKEEMEFLQ